MLWLPIIAVACTPAAGPGGPDDSRGDTSAVPIATVSLRVRAWLTDMGAADCQAWVDGAATSPCEDWGEVPAGARTIAVGDPADTTTDGFPLVRDADGGAWAARPVEVELDPGAELPHYAPGVATEDGDNWTVTLSPNRYVGGEWDCEDGQGAVLANIGIEVVDTELLALPEEMWSHPYTLRVVGAALETDHPEREVGWAPGESSLRFWTWLDGDGADGEQWVCEPASSG